MRPVAFEEVLPLDRYGPVRAAYREAVIAHKRDRRLPVGEKLTLVFEDPSATSDRAWARSAPSRTSRTSRPG